MIQWMTAGSERMREEGVRFLCRHAEDLGVPYKWSTVVNSLHNAIRDEGFMIGVNEQGLVRGVLAYTFGTGEDDYEDRTRMEIHLLYLESGYRGRTELVEVLDALAEREMELPQPIVEIGFYCKPTDGYRRLFGKFATVDNTKEHPCGLLDFYLTTPDRIMQYVYQHPSRR